MKATIPPFLQSSRRLFVLIAFLSAVLAGCMGGGSTGTGGGTFVRGFLTSDSGAPLEDVLVTLEETSEFDRTDENGEFFIASGGVFEEATLTFESEGFAGTVNIDNIPDGTEEIRLEVRRVEDTNAVVTDEIEFSDEVSAPLPNDDGGENDGFGDGSDNGGSGGDGGDDGSGDGNGDGGDGGEVPGEVPTPDDGGAGEGPPPDKEPDPPSVEPGDDLGAEDPVPEEPVDDGEDPSEPPPDEESPPVEDPPPPVDEDPPADDPLPDDTPIDDGSPAE